MLKCVLVTCVLCFYFDLITVCIYIYIQLLSILYSKCVLEKMCCDYFRRFEYTTGLAG